MIEMNTHKYYIFILHINLEILISSLSYFETNSSRSTIISNHFLAISLFFCDS